MLQHIFQEVDNIADTEERLDETTMDALQASDNIINAEADDASRPGDNTRDSNERNTNSAGDF